MVLQAENIHLVCPTFEISQQTDCMMTIPFCFFKILAYFSPLKTYFSGKCFFTNNHQVFQVKKKLYPQTNSSLTNGFSQSGVQM